MFNHITRLAKNLPSQIMQGLSSQNTPASTMQSVAFAMLGEMSFDLLHAPTALDERREVQYAEHQVLSGKPQLQAIGIKLREWSLSLRLHHQLGDVESRYQALVQAKEQMKPLALIFGGTRYEGHYVIIDVHSQLNVCDEQGKPLVRELSLTLKEYAGQVEPVQLGAAVQVGQQPPLSAWASRSVQRVNQGVQLLSKAVKLYKHSRQVIDVFRDGLQMLKQNPIGAITHIPALVERLGWIAPELHKVAQGIPQLQQLAQRLPQLPYFAESLSRMAGQFDAIYTSAPKSGSVQSWINISEQAIQQAQQLAENAQPASTQIVAWIALRQD